MMWKARTSLLAITVGAFGLSSSSSTPPHTHGGNGKVTIRITAGTKWSADDLGEMALEKNMEAAVSRIMFGIDKDEEEKSGVPTIQERVQQRVDEMAVSEVRATILDEAVKERFGTKSKLAKFGATDDPAATCATAGTAGWGGIDVCTAECESKRSFGVWAPYEGACDVLCALAVHPCTNKKSSRNSLTKIWYDNLKQSSPKLKLLALLLAVFTAHFLYSEVFPEMSKTRREKQRLLSMSRESAAITKRFGPPKRQPRQESLYNREGVSEEDLRGIAKAKRDAVRRRLG